MDWSKVIVPKPKSKRVQTSSLAPLDFYKFLVICELIEKSESAVIQTAIYTYIQRTWAAHEERLIFDAAQEGITPEELFIRIAAEAIEKKGIAPDPQPTTSAKTRASKSTTASKTASKSTKRRTTRKSASD